MNFRFVATSVKEKVRSCCTEGENLPGEQGANRGFTRTEINYIWGIAAGRQSSFGLNQQKEWKSFLEEQ